MSESNPPLNRVKETEAVSEPFNPLEYLRGYFQEQRKENHADDDIEGVRVFDTNGNVWLYSQAITWEFETPSPGIIFLTLRDRNGIGLATLAPDTWARVELANGDI